MSAIAAVMLLALAVGPDAVGPAPAPARPDPVARLVATLAGLPATSPVRARVEHRVTFTQGEDEPAPPPGTAWAFVAWGVDGMRVTWNPSLLVRAEAEERARVQDPDAPTPTLDAVADLRTLSLSRAIDAVPWMLRDLADARLLEERLEVEEGTPVRLLVLQVKPSIPGRDRKYVKDVEATARIWLGPDGVPLRSERRVLIKGRIFLVVGFEIEQRDEFRFARAGDRLVVVRHQSDSRSAGAGERRDRHAVTTLGLLD